MLEKTIQLNDGKMIPVLGLGTWQISESVTARVVKDALDAGYRHIDTANAYGNEEGVGEGIRNSGLSREEIFVTSKIPAEDKSYARAMRKIDESLSLLKMDYIDLMLIHCPSPWSEFGQHSRAFAEQNPDELKKYGYYDENMYVWQALEEAVRQGKVRSIGVSNFNNGDTQNILHNCHIRPAVNQINYHIGYEQREIRDFCHKNGILIEAYSPIATGELLHNREVEAMAAKYHVTTAQLSIRFALQETDIALPKTTHKEYMIENAKVDFEISPEDMKILYSAGAVGKWE